MAIANEKLKTFFSKQKIGAFDALLKNSKNLNTTTGKYNQISEEESTKENDTVSIELANQDQTVSIPLDKGNVGSMIPLAISEHTVSKPLAEALAKPLQHSKRTFLKSDLNLAIFSDRELQLLNIIFEKCNQICSLISPVITTAEIRNTLKISPERVRNLIFRIQQKGGIACREVKSGRSACRIFELSQELFQNLLQANKEVGVPLAKALASTSSSSSINNKTTTTTLPGDWLSIDTSLIVNFGITELKNIYAKKLTSITASIVQDSIYQFAWGLKNNPGRYKTVRSYSAILVKELSEGRPWKEDGYVSPERIKEIQKIDKYKALIASIKPYKFSEFYENLSEEEKEAFIPDALKAQINYNIVRKDYYKEYAMKYFEEFIWAKEIETLNLE